jgi:hypothetical protein
VCLSHVKIRNEFGKRASLTDLRGVLAAHRPHKASSIHNEKPRSPMEFRLNEEQRAWQMIARLNAEVEQVLGKAIHMRMSCH